MLRCSPDLFNDFTLGQDQLGLIMKHILKDLRNAPPAKMLIYCQKIYFDYMKNKIDNLN